MNEEDEVLQITYRKPVPKPKTVVYTDDSNWGSNVYGWQAGFELDRARRQREESIKRRMMVSSVTWNNSW